MIATVIGMNRLEATLRDLEALDGGKHGDGGRDHAVAEEQRGAEDPEPAELLFLKA